MNSFFDPIHFHNEFTVTASTRVATAPMKGYYHYHPGVEFLYVHQGAGKVVVNRRTYPIEAGRLFFFQPFQLHIVHPEVSEAVPYVRTVAQFDPVTLDRYAASFPELQSFFHILWRRDLADQCFEMGAQSAFIAALCGAFDSSGRPEHEQTNMLLLLQLVSALRREHGMSFEQIGKGKPRQQRYSERIMQWMEEHYTEEFELDRLAESLHLSRNYVSRVFKEETGGNITDYLMARRVKEACKLLETSDKSVERIGFEVGLPNASYFSQVFKRMAGESPLQYRRRNRNR